MRGSLLPVPYRQRAIMSNKPLGKTKALSKNKAKTQ
tara:strand:- start:129 stop:236 length:108 start_codon:yes stop_codon:yes gene_type:complete